jgi:hypothetical protein
MVAAGSMHRKEEKCIQNFNKKKFEEEKKPL